MNPYFKNFVIALTALVSCHVSFAAEESAPQEAPFVLEDNEFENLGTPEPETDSMAIEEELKSAEPGKKETVDLNKKENVDKNLEDELLLEDSSTPVVEEPAVVPAKPAVVQQQATPPPTKISKGDVEYIHHPQAAKGLISIRKDGSYVYRTNEVSKYDQTGAVRFATMDPPKITAADGTTFEMMYSGGQQPIVSFDYEWQPLSGYGRLGIQAGMGLLLAYGNGRFVNSSLSTKTPKEQYTFVALPLSLGAVYRLEWMSKQWLAPYVAAGGTYIVVGEFRDDGASPNGVGTPGAYGAGGMLFNITAMDRETSFTLRTEYGISNLWVSLDYKYLQTFNEDLDFTSSIIGAGVVIDY